jgi:hypothetical protein
MYRYTPSKKFDIRLAAYLDRFKIQRFALCEVHRTTDDCMLSDLWFIQDYRFCLTVKLLYFCAGLESRVRTNS